LETFSELKDFVENPHFSLHRKKALSKLDLKTIDPPIQDIISNLSQWEYCFTLQSCYGHFVYQGQNNPHSLDPLPITDNLTSIEYRIAYVALCIENSQSGKVLFQHLQDIPAIDPEYIQFGSAEWFWRQQVNTYAIQVEPKNHMYKDTASVSYQEALHLEKIRNEFFLQLKQLSQSLLNYS
jgi:hypothetical protein